MHHSYGTAEANYIRSDAANDPHRTLRVNDTDYGQERSLDPAYCHGLGAVVWTPSQASDRKARLIFNL